MGHALSDSPLFLNREMGTVPTSSYQVRVTKDFLVFSSGHFITYLGDQCEPIHGHNYRVTVEVEDELDANHYVIDFIALKDWTLEILKELDHRMLLPTKSSLILLSDDGPNVRATYRNRYWSFPREECALLPIANTTAELLASYIADRLRSSIAAHGLSTPQMIRVEVEECFGQSARYQWRRDADSPPLM